MDLFKVQSISHDSDFKGEGGGGVGGIEGRSRINFGVVITYTWLCL